MEKGKFTLEERSYLLSLSAVDEVRAKSIVYNKQFKEDCMRRYYEGEKPSKIFADAGLPSSLIGYKRIERAIYHWKEARRKGSLKNTDAPFVRHRNQVDTIKQKKRKAVEKQREICKRKVALMQEKLDKQKRRAKSREEKIIAAQAAKIAALEAEVKALKALGTLARRTQRAPQTTEKTERFELISQLRLEDPKFNISAACKALGVSRRGYYDWICAAPKRIEREQADLEAKTIIESAYRYRGFKKGSRQVKDCIYRKQGIIMNRKKIQRIARKFNLMQKPRRKNPYRRLGVDGKPKVAPNVIEQNFRRGEPLKVISTDITYLRGRSGFTYLSGIIDCETNVVLAHVLSTSLKEKFVLDTYDQLKGLNLPNDIWACSDQGVHYTAQAYRNKLAELGINQSMSKKACCWDNAPIESFWGRMKEQIKSTKNLSHEEITCLVSEYIDYYNNERGQERLGWLTPIEYAKRFKNDYNETHDTATEAA